MATKFDQVGFVAAILVHPSVTQGFDVTIGSGSVLCAGLRKTTNLALGRHMHLNLKRHSRPRHHFGRLRERQPIGLHLRHLRDEDNVVTGVSAVVLNGLTVGSSSTIGGSACVVKDVPPNVVVKGVPAR